MAESKGKTVKILLIVMFCLVASVGTCIGGFAWWVKANKDELGVLGDVLMAKADDVKAEAKAFATTVDQNGCVNHAFRVLKKKGGFMAEVNNGLFMVTCLEAATPSPGICNGVPPTGNILESVGFQATFCADRGALNMQACGRLVSRLQGFCDKN